MNKKKDWCTGFPEYWVTWYGDIFYLGHCCEIHDDKCSFSDFISCLWKNRIVGAIPIALVAGIACWWKHTKLMISRWN